MNSFTHEQQQAIRRRGNVLVLAGAGTGKTRTLVQRCLEWILSNPKDNGLDQVLMVTFTEAAAAEMRHRIRRELMVKIEEGHSILAEQVALLDTAFISTLHSFCLRLVRQHFYQLDLDPQLSVLPPEEASLLAEETLTTILEKRYSGATDLDKAVRKMIHIQGRGWDAPIRRLVRKLHDYTQTLPNPSQWLKEQKCSFSGAEPDQWRKWLFEELPGWAKEWITVLESAPVSHALLTQAIAALRPLLSNLTLAKSGKLLDEIECIYRGTWPSGTAGAVRDRFIDFFEEAAFLSAITNPTPARPPDKIDKEGAFGGMQTRANDDPLVQDWSWVRFHMLALLELVGEFDEAFTQAKRDLSSVDFHDLEQFALRLLWDHENGNPTELARHWRERLKLIFVDEYQDINAVQDFILRALSRDGAGGNRFLVGDPKQSIYRFRLADPRIFRDYVQKWGGSDPSACVVPLRENFRSHPKILELVNSFFGRVMRRELGGVAYDELAQLRPGTNLRTEMDRPSLMPPVELHLCLSGAGDLGESGSEEGDLGRGELSLASLSNVEREARLVGGRLLELKRSEVRVWDRELKKFRAATWSDMVVLLRSPQAKVDSYAKEFSRLGIPLVATRGGFFESQEVADLVNLLTVLDNPLQDIPLLGVLHSPLAAFSLDELALVRLAAKGRFWGALQQFHRFLKSGVTGTNLERFEHECPKLASALRDDRLCKLGLELFQKVDQFLRRFNVWRRLARRTSLSECLDQVTRDVQFETWLLTQNRSEQRRRNVEKLMTWAKQFDQSQRQGLYRFLRFIEAQKEADISVESAPMEADEAVRLMSIHQSKGLEFAIVVLADLGKPFNLSDLRQEIILDEEFGICPVVKSPETEQRFPSLPYWLSQRRQRKEIFGEELRLLYVAMTRACDLLILAGTVSRGAMKKWGDCSNLLSLRELQRARSCCEWICPWVSEMIGTPNWFEQEVGESSLIRWRIHYPDKDSMGENASERMHLSSMSRDGEFATISEAQWIQLERRLSWQYPYREAVAQVAKESVSNLRSRWVINPPRRLPRARSSQKKTQSLGAAGIGKAHHLFLENVAFEKVRTVENLRAELDRLVRNNVLSSVEAGVLDLAAIADFWNSEAGQLVLANSDWVYREHPFTAKLTLGEIEVFRTRYAGGGTVESVREARKTNAEVREAIEPVHHETKEMDGEFEQHHSGHSTDDFIIVSGVIDLLVLMPKEIWILDFKTDAVSKEDWKHRVEEYHPQLDLYGAALERIYGRPVTRRWLYSLSLRQTTLVPRHS